MKSKHEKAIKEALEMHYDKVELKNGEYVCYIEYLDETHIVTPIMFTNDDKSKGVELWAENKETNHKWEVGCLHA